MGSNGRCCSISRWKKGPGRSKGWKQSSFADLRKCRRYSDSDDSRNGTLSQSIRDAPRLAAGSDSPTAISLPGIPSDMPRACGHKPKASDLILHTQLPTDKSRKSVAARGDSNTYRDHFLKSGKGKSKNSVKLCIENDLAAPYASRYNSLESFAREEIPSDVQDRFVSSQRFCPGKFAPLDSRGPKSGGQAANGFTVPYESHVGAILASRFRVSAYICSEACYDLYAVEDLLLEQNCFAKAYTLRGTKGKERDARLRNLKRGSNNTSLLSSFDQNERKWLVFSSGFNLGKDREVLIDPLEWHEENYQTQFPSIDGRCGPCQGQYHLFSKSYAKCFQTSEDNKRDAPSPKARRARDRQRRKRRERRATKAAVRDAVEVQNALLEGSVDSVEPCAKPDGIIPEEGDCQLAPTEPPAPSCPSLEIAIPGKVDQSQTEESRPPTPPKQADLEYRLALHNYKDHIWISCTQSHCKCLACDFSLHVEGRMPDNSRHHATNTSGLIWYHDKAKDWGSSLHHFAPLSYSILIPTTRVKHARLRGLLSVKQRRSTPDSIRIIPSDPQKRC